MLSNKALLSGGSLSNNSKDSFSSEGYFLEKNCMWDWAADTCQDTPIHRGKGGHSWGKGLRAFSSTSLRAVGSRVCLPGSVLKLGEDTPEQGWVKDPASAPIPIPIQCGHHCQLSALWLPGGSHWTGPVAASDQLPALLGAICTPAGGLAADSQPPKSPQGPCSSSGLS